MPNIWEPPNKHALPTPNETKLAEESIELLKIQLQSAMAAPIWAQHAVATLQRHIDERRAWIAPIRRLNHDVLSNIFLDICEEGPSWAPLVLAEVCQVWRQSMLDTPRTWSYLSLREVKSPELRSLYFKRSAPCSLHIGIPPILGAQMTSIVSGITERIKCLRMGGHQYFSLEQYRFPMLERLYLLGEVEGDKKPTNTGFLLDSDNFPRLRSLDALTALDAIPWRTPPFANFVPLQELRITPSDSKVWIMILRHCSESLQSLYVNLSWIEDFSPVSHPETVQFPRLEHMAIYSWFHEIHIPWAIDAKTPILQTYKEGMPHDFKGPLHKDTATVVSLDFTGVIDLSFFPSVRQMEPHRSRLVDTIGELCADPDACPNLELIVDEELGNGGAVIRAKEMIAARNAKTGREIRFGPKLQYGVFSYPGIPAKCGGRMPCSI